MEKVHVGSTMFMANCNSRDLLEMFFYFRVISLRIKRKEPKINLVDFAVCCELKIIKKVFMYSNSNCFLPYTGLLILRDGAILHNRPQIASDRTIHEKSHNSQKIAHYSQNQP